MATLLEESVKQTALLEAIDMKLGLALNILSSGSGGGAATFDPTTVSGCVGWFEADPDYMTLEVGDKVSTWVDRSGTGDATQAVTGNQPTYLASGTDGVPVVEFDLNTKHMDFASRNVEHVFLVSRYLTQSGTHRLFGSSDIARLTAANAFQFIGTTPVGTQNGTSITTGEDFSAWSYPNLTEISYGAANTLISIGHATSNLSAQAEHLEILLYSSPLTGDDYDYIRDGLAAKHGITI